MNKQIQCGVLAFQGNFAEHLSALEILGVSGVKVNQAKQIADLTHLIIPGGESTVMSAFFHQTGIEKIIHKQVISKKLKIFGTCAGAILLAKKVISDQKIENLGLIDLTIKRNAYGSQIHSFETDVDFLPEKKTIKAIFIRPPKIIEIGQNVEILAYNNANPILVKQNNILLSTFHPEYLIPPIIHKYFLEIGNHVQKK